MHSAKKQKILITSALPYANGSIHLGHMVEYIQTDMYVRALKLLGNDVIYCCADDTHGTPIEIKASQLKVAPEQMIAEVYKEHTKDFADFLINFDNYYSTNSPENKAYSDQIFHALQKAGLIYQKAIDVIYCEHCKRFLPDRFVKGTCPKCSAVDQYGDVCEKCSSTHKTTDLIDPKCSLCGKKPVVKQSEHYFFKLSTLAPKLKAYLEAADLQDEIVNYCEKWLSDLQDWCISRDGPYFGFKIPGEDNKYYYVWLDAPIGYIASTANLCAKTKHGHAEEYWQPKNPKDSKIIHFIGKDIVYFHLLFWPAVLMHAGFKVPDKIMVHGFLTVNKEKMSKSRGTFITARNYLTYLPPEYLRFYYAAHLSPKLTDLDFDVKHFKEMINNELVANVGNLVFRAISFVERSCDGTLTAYHKPKEATELTERIARVKQHYESLNFKEAVAEILHISSIANKYFQEHEPWKRVSDGKKKEAQEVLTVVINVVKDISILIKPILPKTSAQIEKQLLVSSLGWNDLNTVLENCKIGKPELLFKKLEDETDHLFVQEAFPLDLRIGTILEVKQHLNADKLFVETIDFGSEKRTVVSGIKQWYKPEELVGKNVVVVCNLKPAQIRGVESQGMVLTAEYKKDVTHLLKVLEAPKAKPGEQVFLDSPQTAFKTIDFKEFEKLAFTVGNKQILLSGKPLRTKDAPLAIDMENGARIC